MPIEEQAEEKIQNAVQTIITGGAKLMLRIPKGVAMALLRSGMKLTKTGVHAAGEAVKNKIDSGEMSEKRLQRKKDGDLHELQLDDSTMREVQHSLKTAGIDYHLERTDQGQFILHFAGKDEDHVRHAVQRAFKGMGLDVTDDDFTVEQTEQTRNEPDPPARETPAEPAMKPMPTQRIAWDFVDPEVMEMAANSLAARHPELSWDKLMGDTTCDEQAGRDFADRIIGKAAADPSLRDELDAILRDEFAAAGLEGKVWQYFVSVPDFRATGVRDGVRAFEWPAIIRAVNTVDAMTAEVPELDWALLKKITERILNEVPGICRVCYDLTPKPCGTIEWE